MSRAERLDAEDNKIVVLARATRARTGADEGAAVRDTDGRTYAAATVTLPSLRLTALQAATGACGSLIIALALYEGRLDAESAFAASQLDETFQIEAWGEDAEASKRRDALAADIAAVARFFTLLDG